MKIKSTGTCRDCRKEGNRDPLQNNIEQIGDSISTDTSGRRKSRTDYIFFQCKKCGSIWMAIESYDAKGLRTSWKRLTKGFF